MLLGQVVGGIGHGLDIVALFFYKALWSILFGVAVTAAVDVFVDKDKMARLLGRSDAKTIGVATAAGAASSACTFGAVTVAQSLFKKGASAQSTFAFALAATNIVFELGILIYILLGWSYLGGELLSGVVLIVLVWLIARFTLPKAVFELSRRRLQEADGDAGAPNTDDRPACRFEGPRPFSWTHDGTTYQFCSRTCRAGFQRQIEGRGSVRAQLSTLGGWNRVAERYFKTISRIWWSVAFGFLIAGFIVALVPAKVFAAVFLPTDTFLGVLENAAVGVLAGVFSFIGSIGIVPFAAALVRWGWVRRGARRDRIGHDHAAGAAPVEELPRRQGHRLHLRRLLQHDGAVHGRDRVPVPGAGLAACPTGARFGGRGWVEGGLHAVDHHRVLGADRRVVAGPSPRTPRRGGGGYRPGLWGEL